MLSSAKLKEKPFEFSRLRSSIRDAVGNCLFMIHFAQSALLKVIIASKKELKCISHLSHPVIHHPSFHHKSGYSIYWVYQFRIISLHCLRKYTELSLKSRATSSSIFRYTGKITMKKLLNVVKLRGVPIHEQLRIEEILLRRSNQNWYE